MNSDWDLEEMFLNRLASGEMGPITSYILEGTKLRTSMASSMGSLEDQSPDNVPFQPQNFMSSTKLKKIHIAKRHLDTFGGTEYSIPSKRGMILHTDRYSWEGARPLEGSVSQRDRLRLEIDYIEKLRGLKKRKEVWPHRMDIDMLMAGKSVEFEERFDLNGELQHLKALVLPDTAKDLYHGKGIKLPSNHSSVKPRQRGLYNGLDDGGVSSSLPSPLRGLNPAFALDPDIRQGWPTMSTQGRSGLLPGINDHKQTIRLGIGVDTPPVSISEARRTTKGRKLSQPPSSILPQSVPTSLPRLELHGSRTLTTAYDQQQPIQRESSSKKNSALPLSNKINETSEEASNNRVIEPDVNPNKISRNESDYNLPESNQQATDVALDSYRLSTTENRLSDDDEHINDDDDDKDVNEEEGACDKHLVNPLQGADVEQLISAGERTQLTQKFQTLDTEHVGHLQFEQLQSQLPTARNQELYLKQVYDIVSSQTVFGVDEFMMMNLLTDTIDQLSDKPAQAFTTVDLETLHKPIIKYTELFESVDRGHNGFITVSSLKEILSTILDQQISTLSWNQLLQNIAKEDGDRLTKIEFLSLIPYFQTLDNAHV